VWVWSGSEAIRLPASGGGSLGKEPQTIGRYGGLDLGLRAKYRLFYEFPDCFLAILYEF